MGTSYLTPTPILHCSEFQLFLASLVCPVITIQREPVSAVSSDINFPMKGRRGMKDWARTAEDKLFIPKEVFTNPTEGRRTKTEIHWLGFVQTLAFLAPVRTTVALPAVHTAKIWPSLGACVKGLEESRTNTSHHYDQNEAKFQKPLICFESVFVVSSLSVLNLRHMTTCYHPTQPTLQPRSDQEAIPVHIHILRDVPHGKQIEGFSRTLEGNA